jgi:hypothetical protein
MLDYQEGTTENYRVFDSSILNKNKFKFRRDDIYSVRNFLKVMPPPEGAL